MTTKQDRGHEEMIPGNPIDTIWGCNEEEYRYDREDYQECGKALGLLEVS